MPSLSPSFGLPSTHLSQTDSLSASGLSGSGHVLPCFGGSSPSAGKAQTTGRSISPGPDYRAPAAQRPVSPPVRVQRPSPEIRARLTGGERGELGQGRKTDFRSAVEAQVNALNRYTAGLVGHSAKHDQASKRPHGLQDGMVSSRSIRRLVADGQPNGAAVSAKGAYASSSRPISPAPTVAADQKAINGRPPSPSRSPGIWQTIVGTGMVPRQSATFQVAPDRQVSQATNYLSSTQSANAVAVPVQRQIVTYSSAGSRTPPAPSSNGAQMLVESSTGSRTPPAPPSNGVQMLGSRPLSATSLSATSLKSSAPGSVRSSPATVRRDKVVVVSPSLAFRSQATSCSASPVSSIKQASETSIRLRNGEDRKLRPIPTESEARTESSCNPESPGKSSAARSLDGHNVTKSAVSFNMHGELRQLRHELQQHEISSAELREVQKEIDTLRKQRANLQDAKDQGDSEKKELTRENTELWSRIAEHRQQIDHLTGAVEQLRQQLAPIEIASTTSTVGAPTSSGEPSLDGRPIGTTADVAESIELMDVIQLPFPGVSQPCFGRVVESPPTKTSKEPAMEAEAVAAAVAVAEAVAVEEAVAIEEAVVVEEAVAVAEATIEARPPVESWLEAKIETDVVKDEVLSSIVQKVDGLINDALQESVIAASGPLTQAALDDLVNVSVNDTSSPLELPSEYLEAKSALVDGQMRKAVEADMGINDMEVVRQACEERTTACEALAQKLRASKEKMEQESQKWREDRKRLLSLMPGSVPGSTKDSTFSAPMSPAPPAQSTAPSEGQLYQNKSNEDELQGVESLPGEEELAKLRNERARIEADTELRMKEIAWKENQRQLGGEISKLRNENTASMSLAPPLEGTAVPDRNFSGTRDVNSAVLMPLDKDSQVLEIGAFDESHFMAQGRRVAEALMEMPFNFEKKEKKEVLEILPRRPSDPQVSGDVAGGDADGAGAEDYEGLRSRWPVLPPPSSLLPPASSLFSPPFYAGKVAAPAAGPGTAPRSEILPVHAAPSSAAPASVGLMQDTMKDDTAPLAAIDYYTGPAPASAESRLDYLDGLPLSIPPSTTSNSSKNSANPVLGKSSKLSGIDYYTGPAPVSAESRLDPPDGLPLSMPPSTTSNSSRSSANPVPGKISKHAAAHAELGKLRDWFVARSAT